MPPTAAPPVVRRLRKALNLASDYDRGLRERWAGEWGRTLAPGGRLLDAGAGDLHLAALFPGQRYVGIDIRAAFPPGRRVPGVTGDLHAIPLADGSVDNAVSIEVLEHVTDPGAVLAELKRVLRPGGELCLSVPQAGAEHEQPHDYFRFTSFGLAHLAREAGLEVATIRMKGFFFRRLSAELRDLPFVVLPEQGRYRFPLLALVARWGLVGVFTFGVATLLLPLDSLDRSRSYSTGYFCILRRPACDRPTP